MGAATGLVGGRGALATGAGVKGFGVERRSTGLAGGPVPANFGRSSGTRGFCGEQSVRWVSWDTAACLQGPHVCPGWAVGSWLREVQ